MHLIGVRTVDSVAAYLGDKPFMGAEPTGIDATMLAFAAAALCPVFESPIWAAAERHDDNLRRYVARMTARYYPELGEIAGCKTAA